MKLTASHLTLMGDALPSKRSVLSGLGSFCKRPAVVGVGLATAFVLAGKCLVGAPVVDALFYSAVIFATSTFCACVSRLLQHFLLAGEIKKNKLNTKTKKMFCIEKHPLNCDEKLKNTKEWHAIAHGMVNSNKYVGGIHAAVTVVWAASGPASKLAVLPALVPFFLDVVSSVYRWRKVKKDLSLVAPKPAVT